MDSAKSLASEEAIVLRRHALLAPHMQPLAEYVHQLRTLSPAGVPDFDPLDGGINAECLLLLEAPGRKAIGSGFVSRNNPDQTASNFFDVNAEAGLPRSRTVIWNAVPWYIGDGNRIRAASSSDLHSAKLHLVNLFKLLQNLRVVVLVGKKAQRHATAIAELAPWVTVLTCPHPSPLSFNGRPERRAEVVACLRSVVKLLEQECFPISLQNAPNPQPSLPP